MIGRNSGAGALLGDFIRSIESLEEQKAEILEQIRAKKNEAKGYGFDLKVINQMLRERRMDAWELQEFRSLCEIYRGALGMLNDTPLGESARRRLMGEVPDPEQFQAPLEAASEAPDIESAREAGGQAAREGKRVIDNPFIAGDPRRAAWDEGWCAQTGSDGMEIPEHWRRKPKKKPPADEGNEESQTPEGDGDNEAPEGE